MQWSVMVRNACLGDTSLAVLRQDFLLRSEAAFRQHRVWAAAPGQHQQQAIEVRHLIYVFGFNDEDPTRGLSSLAPGSINAGLGRTLPPSAPMLPHKHAVDAGAQHLKHEPLLARAGEAGDN